MSNELQNQEQITEQTYLAIRSSVITAQTKVYSAVNAAMVIAYHEIGEQIYDTGPGNWTSIRSNEALPAITVICGTDTHGN